MAIPDHPWTKATKDAAMVRIAMTVAQAGSSEGDLLVVESESGLDTDTPRIVFSEKRGKVNSDLSIGVNVSAAKILNANKGIAHDGVKLHGSGFILSREEALYLGLEKRPGLDSYIKEYCNGRDLTQHSRRLMVADLFGLTDAQVRSDFPEIYQHLLKKVKPERDANKRASYKENWWIFGEPRREMRPALLRLPRYIATVDTAKHRVFQFLPAGILCDDKVVVFATDSAFHLGVLSSQTHCMWALRAGGWMGIGNDPVYSKSRCFDPFPFPIASETQKTEIGGFAGEIDELRKRVLAEHPHLTLTGLYNVRARLVAGERPETFEYEDRRIFEDGLVLILHELHEKLDAAVAGAYGWEAGLGEAEILGRLVALNAARVAEEAVGKVRWLRPEYQIPRFGAPAEKLDLRGGKAAEIVVPVAEKRAFPKEDLAQTDAVVAALHRAGRTDAAGLAARFTQGRRVVPQVEAVLGALVARGEVARVRGGYVLQR